MDGPPQPIDERISIVDFNGDDTLGTCDIGGSYKIEIAKKVLSDHEKLLHVLVHEEAHAISSRGDCDSVHTRTIETIWIRLYFGKCRDAFSTPRA